VVENGANVDAFDERLESALHVACSNVKQSSTAETVSYLMNKAQVSLDAQNKEGITPLMYLLQNDATSLIERLVRNSVDVNRVDKEGDNALMFACCQEEISCQTIEALIAAGSLFDPSKYNNLRGDVIDSYVKRFPLRCLRGLLAKLLGDLSALNNQRATPEIINKMNLEWGNDLTLNDIFQLPYHRVLDGVKQFVEMAKGEAFYEIDEWELEMVQQDIRDAVEALARAAHTSEEGRRMAEDMALRDTEGMRKRPRNGK
jgi:ankyrin repeat protein